MDVQWARFATWRTGGLFVIILLTGLITAYYADGLVRSALVLVATLFIILVADYFQR